MLCYLDFVLLQNSKKIIYNDVQKFYCYSAKYESYTRWIVLPLLTKALYEFGFFEGIFQKAKFALLLFYWVSLIYFFMMMFYYLSVHNYFVIPSALIFFSFLACLRSVWEMFLTKFCKAMKISIRIQPYCSSSKWKIS